MVKTVLPMQGANILIGMAKKKKKPKGHLTWSETIGLFVFLHFLCFPIYISSFLYQIFFLIIRRIQTISANKI